MKTLPEIKKELKDILPNGIDITINAIKAYLYKGSDIYDELLLFEGRYRDLTTQLVQGIISNENAQLGFNILRKDLLAFIGNLEEHHLSQPEAAGVPIDIYNGELLYRIPTTMAWQKEVKCLVRLALSKKVLLEGLEIRPDDVLKDIRISDVMGVELIDPSASPAFSIRTISDQVQWVEKDLHTEWIFYVQPLMIGTFPLVLKISVIEIINGVERRRNVVLEELVQITADYQLAGKDSDTLAKSGFSLSHIPGNGSIKKSSKPVFPGHKDEDENSNIPRMVEKDDRTSGNDKYPEPSPVIMPHPVERRKSGFRIPGIITAMMLLLVISWVVLKLPTPNFSPQPHLDSSETEQAIRIALQKNTKEAYEDLLRVHPGTKAAELAVMKLDSIEISVWEKARIADDTLLLQEYVRQYPIGKFTREAEVKIIEKRNIMKRHNIEILRKRGHYLEQPQG